MRTINEKTIERVQRWLKVVKDSEGKELNLAKVTKTFNLQNSTPWYAKQLGLVDFNKGRITKVHYVNAEPHVARRLLEYMNKKKRENDAARKVKQEKPQETLKAETKITPDIPVQKQENKPDKIQVETKPKRHKRQIKVFGIPIVTIIEEQ